MPNTHHPSHTILQTSEKVSHPVWGSCCFSQPGSGRSTPRPTRPELARPPVQGYNYAGNGPNNTRLPPKCDPLLECEPNGRKLLGAPPRRRLARPYNPAPPPSPPRAPIPTYTHLSFLYKRRVPCFDPSRSNVTFLTGKKSTGNWVRTCIMEVLCLAHTLPGRLPCYTIAPTRSLCESGHFRAPALHCEQDDLLSLATNLLRNH